jgi:hypothetical protein
VRAEDTQVLKPEDVWPESETVAYAPPPPPPPLEPAEPPPSRSLGNGLIVGLTVVLLIVAGAAFAYYLTHRNTSSTANTVTVTTAAAPAKAKSEAAQRSATTTPTTTAPVTTAAAPPQPTTATVPDVSHQPEAAAVQSLGQAGILASLAFVPARDELGTVEAQAKAAGTTMPYDGHMQINVSTGPGQKPSEPVPNVIGQSVKQALGAINGAHLRLIYLRIPVTDPTQAWKVVQQSPLGGSHAPQNAQVVVYVGQLKQ